MVQGIFMYSGNCIICSKGIWKDRYCIRVLCFSSVCPGSVTTGEESLPQKVTTEFAVFTLYMDFYFCAKAFILHASYNLWGSVEAKSAERGVMPSRSSSSICSKWEKPVGPCYSVRMCCFLCVSCPVPFVWNFSAFLLYFKNTFLGKHRPCCPEMCWVTLHKLIRSWFSYSSTTTWNVKINTGINLRNVAWACQNIRQNFISEAYLINMDNLKDALSIIYQEQGKTHITSFPTPPPTTDC